MDFPRPMGPSVVCDISLSLDNMLHLSLGLSNPQMVARGASLDPEIPSWFIGSWDSPEGLRILGLTESVASGWPQASVCNRFCK